MTHLWFRDPVSAAMIAVLVLLPFLWSPSARAQDSNIVFEDGFESGDLSAWDNVATDRYTVTDDPARVRSGGFAMEGVIEGDGWGEVNKWFLPGLDQLYFRFYVMFEQGFMNLRGDGNGMHFASVAGNRIDNQWSSHGQAGIVPNGTDFFVTTVDPNHSYDDPTLEPFMFYSYFPDMNCCYGSVFTQTEPAVPIRSGAWHEVIVYVDAGTPGVADGSQSLWIDGELKIQVENMRWRDTDDLRLNEVAFVNYMPGTPQVQHIWIDDVSVTTGFPGTEIQPGPFVDVSATHQFATEITWLADSGITTGCSTGGFCPNDPVTRDQMASFLARALGLPASSTDWFGDDAGSVHEPNINSLADAGVTLGCGGASYCPAELVERDQMASFLVRALGLPASSADWFTDDDNNAHEPNINSLADSAITQGCAVTGRFCPDDPVTRGQMAAFLYRAFAT